MASEHAVKLTVTYSDGSTEDFDTFMAAVVTGLIPVGKDDDGTILYTAGENLSSQGLAHIAATAEVSAVLIEASLAMIHKLVKNVPPEIAFGFLEALLTLSSEETEGYHDSRVVKRNQG